MGVAPSKTELIDLFWRSVWTFLEVVGGIITGDFIMQAIDGGGGIQMARLPLYAGAGAVIAGIKTFASNKAGTGTATSKPSAPAGFLQPVASDHATPA